MPLKLNETYLKGIVREEEICALSSQIETAEHMLNQKCGLGSDFLGWIDLPENYDKAEFARIKAAAAKIQKNSDVLIVIGIGGSYLGARAVVELLTSPFYNNLKKNTPNIYFVGNNLNPTYLNEVLSLCEGKDFSVNVISKSGTTTEPALAFRVFRNLLIQKYGESGAKERIFATTDQSKGTLKELSDREGYETFVVPDDIGGRYSVLTAVGLLPIATAGINIDDLMKGAQEARKALSVPDITQNDAYRYAALRNILLRKGKSVEMLVSYEPAFQMMAEWFKQLFAESEGKDHKGIFPASATFSTDLHSLGQFIQDGSRIMFETVVNIQKPKQDFFIEADKHNYDGLNFLSNQNMSEVNKKAMLGTILAHTEGGTPNIVLDVPELSAAETGYMIYFFEKSCALSGYLLGVNPFNQPGVESYKKNMFALLDKPGYEKEKAALEAKLH